MGGENADRSATEREEAIYYVRQILLQVVNIQSEQFRRLLDEKHEIPLDIAEVFEDAANTYLDIAEMIHRRSRGEEPVSFEEVGLGDVGPGDVSPGED